MAWFRVFLADNCRQIMAKATPKLAELKKRNTISDEDSPYIKSLELPQKGAFGDHRGVLETKPTADPHVELASQSAP